MSARIETLEDETFDPLMSDDSVYGVLESPYPKIHELRRQSSVHHVQYRQIFGFAEDDASKGLEHYSVFGYDEIAAVYADPQTFSSEKAFNNDLEPTFGRVLTVMDQPEHTHFRSIFQKAFLPAAVRSWGDIFVLPAVEELISAFSSDGSADLVSGFTMHYPFRSIYRLMGLPEEDMEIFHRLAQAQNTYVVYPDQGKDASAKLGRYFQRLIDERRMKPSDDIISVIANAEDNGKYLPDYVVISFLRQLINAAADTTYRTTSMILTGLLTNPDQLAAVYEDRKLVPHAIEEGLRWDGPVLFTHRWVNRDVDLGGVTIPKGAKLDVVNGGGNRDETKFIDPDHYNVFRKSPYKSFAFAQGPHVCIGRQLSKISMELAVNTLLDRCPNLRLDPEKVPPLPTGFTFRSPRNIHVRFG